MDPGRCRQAGRRPKSLVLTIPEKQDTTTGWEVVAATLHDRGDPGSGARELTLVRGAEEEVRRVFADTTAQAAGHGYDYVSLRCDGSDVEHWPQETGWTV